MPHEKFENRWSLKAHDIILGYLMDEVSADDITGSVVENSDPQYKEALLESINGLLLSDNNKINTEATLDDESEGSEIKKREDEKLRILVEQLNRTLL